jgi:hypothetical protein
VIAPESHNEFRELAHTFVPITANAPMRRRWLRENLWPSIPVRPVARWMQIYLLCGGILDGYAGTCIATMHGWQELCVELKAEELSQRVQSGVIGEGEHAS